MGPQLLSQKAAYAVVGWPADIGGFPHKRCISGVSAPQCFEGCGVARDDSPRIPHLRDMVDNMLKAFTRVFRRGKQSVAKQLRVELGKRIRYPAVYVIAEP